MLRNIFLAVHLDSLYLNWACDAIWDLQIISSPFTVYLPNRTERGRVPLIDEKRGDWKSRVTLCLMELYFVQKFFPAQPGSWERPLVPSLLKLLFITTLDLPPKPPKPHIKEPTFPEWDFKIKFHFAPKINKNIFCFEDSLCFSFCAKCEVEF